MKEFLSRTGVKFDTRLLTDEANRREVAARGSGPAPLTIIGDEPFWGFDREALTAALGRIGLATLGATAAICASSWARAGTCV